MNQSFYDKYINKLNKLNDCIISIKYTITKDIIKEEKLE